MSWLPFLVDGLLLGSTLALGAVGLTLTYSILGFANFTHGDLITWGAYFVLSLLLAWTATGVSGLGRLGALSFGWPFLGCLVAAMALTGLLGLLLDRILFRPLRQQGTQIVLVIASFGASLALRYGLAFVYGPEPAYYTREIQLAAPILPGVPGVRATPDQLFVLGLAAVLVVGLHLLLTRTTLGRSMRAVSENPALARVVGVDPQVVARWTWLIGALWPRWLGCSWDSPSRSGRGSASICCFRSSPPRSWAASGACTGRCSGGSSSAWPRPWPFRSSGRSTAPLSPSRCSWPCCSSAPADSSGTVTDRRGGDGWRGR